nr:MAG TPA: hypothetical protein [Caudoviricetes sp.]
MFRLIGVGPLVSKFLRLLDFLMIIMIVIGLKVIN